MTVEYVLLILLFAFGVMGSLTALPYTSFEKAGPKLGARVERHLNTGNGFGTNGGATYTPAAWE